MKYYYLDMKGVILELSLSKCSHHQEKVVPKSPKMVFGLRTPKLVQSRLIAFLTTYHHDPLIKVFKSQDIRILKISIVTCLKLSTHTCIGESPNWPK